MNRTSYRVNELLAQAYEIRCQAVARNYPVILHLEDTSLVLYEGENRTEAKNPNRAAYDLLKSVSHLPLAIHVGGDSDSIQELLPHLKQEVRESFLSEPEKSTQNHIIAVCSEFLGKSSDSRKLAYSLRKEIQLNIARAAELRVQGMHEQLTRWARELGTERWRELRIVIVTSHMARRENLPELYFRWLLAQWLSDGSISQRIFKVEGIDKEEEALRVLGVYIVDSEIGNTFFGKSEQMHRDLLSSGLTEILNRLSRDFS